MTWTASDFRHTEFAATGRRPPPQTGRMTPKKLKALIDAGYGYGHLHNYKPFLRVTKRDYSIDSFVGHLPSQALNRLHHYRAIAERKTIQLVFWLGAEDAREGYPMWPWEHSHPGEGLPGFELAPQQPGLLKIARDAGIEHGIYPGSKNIPYVGTIDILTTWRNSDGSRTLIAIDCKPRYILCGGIKFLGKKERLELARRYCNHAAIRYIVLHAEDLPAEFCANLDAFFPSLDNFKLANIMESDVYREIVQVVSANGYETPPTELLSKLSARNHLNERTCHQHFHLALWFGDIDHDLGEPFQPWHPLRRGGNALRERLRQAFLTPSFTIPEYGIAR